MKGKCSRCQRNKKDIEYRDDCRVCDIIPLCNSCHRSHESRMRKESDAKL